MRVVAMCEGCAGSEDCVRRVREAAARIGLDVVLETTLRTHPGSVHLHLRKRGERAGILEYTMVPATGRAWLSTHANREREWIAPAIAELVAMGCIRQQEASEANGP